MVLYELADALSFSVAVNTALSAPYKPLPATACNDLAIGAMTEGYLATVLGRSSHAGAAAEGADREDPLLSAAAPAARIRPALAPIDGTPLEDVAPDAFGDEAALPRRARKKVAADEPEPRKRRSRLGSTLS